MSLCELYEFVSTTRCKGTSYYKVELTGLIDNHGEERTCIATAQVYDNHEWFTNVPVSAKEHAINTL